MVKKTTCVTNPMSLLFFLKHSLSSSSYFFSLTLPIRSLEAEDFRLVVSWSSYGKTCFPEGVTEQQRSLMEHVFFINPLQHQFMASWKCVLYLLMVKSRISAVWPRYSDTMLPERASHKRSAPSKLQVDTTEDDSSHWRWTMPAWRNIYLYAFFF